MCVQGVASVFLYPLANFLFNKYFVKIVDPATDFIFGGPTGVVIKALKRVTPFLSPSPLGERLESFLVNFVMNMINIITTLATNIPEQAISYSLQGFTTGVSVGAALIEGFFDFIFRTLDLLGIGASIGTLIKLSPQRVSVSLNSDQTKTLSIDKDKSRGRSESVNPSDKDRKA